MAGLKCRVGNSGMSSTTSARTMIELTAPADTGLRVRKFTCTFAGTSPTQAKILVEVLKGGTTGTGTNKDPVKLDGHDGDPQATGKHTLTAEPGGSPVVIWAVRVHPQGGVIDIPLDVVVNPAEIIFGRVTSANDISTDMSFEFEE